MWESVQYPAGHFWVRTAAHSSAHSSAHSRRSCRSAVRRARAVLAWPSSPGWMAARNGDRPPGAASAPCRPAAGRAAEQQLAAGPGHPDEQQPPLFRGIGRGERPGAGPSQRQQAALAAGQEHHLEFQALGAVQGEQGDRLGPRVERVGFRAQRHLGQEPLQVVAAAAGQRGQHLARGPDVQRGRTALRRRAVARARTAAVSCRGQPSPAAALPSGRSACAARGRSSATPGRRAAGRANASGTACRPGSGPGRRRGLRVGAVQDGDVGRTTATWPARRPGRCRGGGTGRRAGVDGGRDPGRLGVLVGGLVA